LSLRRGRLSLLQLLLRLLLRLLERRFPLLHLLLQLLNLLLLGRQCLAQFLRFIDSDR
jgi:hypothetical protein